MNTSSLFVFLALLCLATSVYASYCNPPTQDPATNNYPIWKKAPTFVRQVKNGKLFQVGADNVKVMHVWGTPYEKGFAHGTLLKNEVKNFTDQVWQYFESQVESVIQSLPKWLQEKVANAGLDLILELFYDFTKQYTGNYIYEEMKGLADASGVPFDRLKKIHMIGEATKGHCSMFGLWGDALKNTNRSLLQLRALDWAVDGPFIDFPLVMVSHANSENENSWINIGFTSWLGSITGMNEKKLAISEIGVSDPDNTWGDESTFGVPFVFLLRDILQFDNGLTDSINRIANAKRTCHLILGVGDGKSKSFRGVQYSHSIVRFMDDENMLPNNATWHPRIKDTVYYGMDWECPGYNQKLSQQIQKHYGNITPEITIKEIISLVQTGNLHVAIYDFDNMKMYVSFAAPSNYHGKEVYAFQRQFFEIDAAALFAEKM